MPDSSLPSQDDEVLKGERRRLVLGGLAKLNRRYRTAVELRYFHDMGPREIAAVLGCSPAPEVALPNVILISIDTLRADHLGCYGYPRPTSPAVDAFRQDAVLFETAIAQAPSTLHSHASILTSLLPHHHGASWGAKRRLSEDVVSVTEVLAEAGYQTAAFTGGGHAYHATLPTDGLRRLRDVMVETESVGFETLRTAQIELGRRVRALLVEKGFPSVAASGFEAPSVVVSYTSNSDIVARFADAGAQVAAGVPLMCDEPSDYSAFRIGLFGLDKLEDVDGTLARLQGALDQAIA